MMRRSWLRKWIKEWLPLTTPCHVHMFNTASDNYQGAAKYKVFISNKDAVFPLPTGMFDKEVYIGRAKKIEKALFMRETVIKWLNEFGIKVNDRQGTDIYVG